MADEYSIILKGKSIASLLSFAGKKLNVEIGDLRYEVLSKPIPPESLFKLKITATKNAQNKSKKQKLKFTLEENKTKLFLTAFPPEKDEIPFNIDDVVNVLVTKHKIAVKIDKWEIERAITLSTKSKKATKVLVAKSELPKTGDDGVIELIKEFKNSKGEIAEIYLKNPEETLYRCEIVEKNQIIAIVHKPKTGVSGKTVFGEIIEGTLGKPVTYSVHKHIICVEFPNRIELRTPEQGRVTLYKNLFRFYSVVEHKKPLVGKQTNIKVDGDLVIDEYIENGAKVNVKGNIKVKDDIFNAFVDCQGNLTVENGISNSKKGFISINGDLSCAFLQKAIVWVENNVLINKSVLNSHVYAGNNIKLENKGIIRNSNIFFSTTLKTEKIENSIIRAGISFSAQQRFKRLEKNKQLLIEEQIQLEKKIGPSFINLDIRKLTLENDMLQDVYKRKRELKEILLNIASVEKEITQLLEEHFNVNTKISVKLIKQGCTIFMKELELLIEKDLINMIFYYDIEKNKISFYKNNSQ